MGKRYKLNNEERPLLMRKNPIKKSDDVPVENTSQTKKKTWSKRIFGTKKNGKSDTKQKSSQYEGPSGLVLSSSSSGSASKTGEEPKAPKRTPVSPETPKTPALPRYFPGEPEIVKKVLSRPFGRDTLLVKDFKVRSPPPPAALQVTTERCKPFLYFIRSGRSFYSILF